MISEIINNVFLLAATAVDTLTNAAGNNGSIKLDFSNVLENDGIMISIIGYSIVFIALVLLYLFISNLTRILISRQSRKLKAEGKQKYEKEELSIPGEINAAISMALHLHFEEAHDYESAVLTIKKAQRHYSPWSSKIYNISVFPQRHVRRKNL